MWTPEFERFVAPARRRPQLWRVALGLVLIFAVYVALHLGTVALVGLLIVFQAPPTDAVEMQRWFGDFVVGRNPTGVVAVLLCFAGMVLGAAMAARWLHSRPISSLWGTDIWRGFAPAALITLGIGGLSALLAFGEGVELVPNTPLPMFLTFLPAALLALAIQTGAEEVVFRGYLQGQLAARFQSPLVWMLLPSLLFGALHVDHASLIETGRFAENDAMIFAATTLVGLLAADLTRVTGSLGAAWGLHFANNVQALLIVSLDDVLSGLSLWHTPFGPHDTEVLPMLLVQDMVLLMVIWAAIRLWLSRRRHGALA